MSASGTYAYWPKVNNPNKQYIQMESGGDQPMFFFGGSQVPLAFGLNHVHGSGISGDSTNPFDRMPEPRPMYKTLPVETGKAKVLQQYRVTPIREESDLLKLQRGRASEKVGRNRTYGRAIRPIYKGEFNNEVKHLSDLSSRELSGKGIDHPTISLSDHVDKIYIPRHLGSMNR